MEGQLHVKDRTQRLPITDSIIAIGKGSQLAGDDRGHLIADRFGGSNGLENLIAQNAEINRVDFNSFENQLSQEIKSGKTVAVAIYPVYSGSSFRPTALLVNYTIDGIEDFRVFPN